MTRARRAGSDGSMPASDSIGPGFDPRRPPWGFSRRAGYESAPGFIFTLPFIIIILHYTNSYTYSNPNLNFL